MTDESVVANPKNTRTPEHAQDHAQDHRTRSRPRTRPRTPRTPGSPTRTTSSEPTGGSAWTKRAADYRRTRFRFLQLEAPLHPEPDQDSSFSRFFAVQLCSSHSRLPEHLLFTRVSCATASSPSPLLPVRLVLINCLDCSRRADRRGLKSPTDYITPSAPTKGSVQLSPGLELFTRSEHFDLAHHDVEGDVDILFCGGEGCAETSEISSRSRVQRSEEVHAK